MSLAAAQPASGRALGSDSGAGGLGAGILFFLAFAFVWVSVEPFRSRAPGFPEWPEAMSTSQLSKMVLMLLLVALALVALHRGKLGVLLQPSLLLTAIFGWMAVAALGAPEPIVALVRLATSAAVVLIAHVLLYLPRDEQHFARLLTVGIGVVLVLCYFGVAFLPDRSVHQLGESTDIALVGDWRGIYPHKNTAALAMALGVLIGLYVARAWSRSLGWTLAGASAIFLAMSGGKTALALLPLTLVVIWATERWPRRRRSVVLGVLGCMALFTLGNIFSEEVPRFIAGLGIDASFTGRIDIWRLAWEAATDSPLLGYGYQSFWQSEAVGQMVLTPSWAADSSDGHNGYLDLLLHAGVPALVLALVWLVLLPLRDIERAEQQGNSPHLTRLFKRIWLFALLVGFLESIFFIAGVPIWFMLLIAVFGLRLQGQAKLVTAILRKRTATVAHA